LIFAELQQAADQFADRVAIVTTTRNCTYGELAAEAQRISGEMRRGPVTGEGGNLPRLVAALAAADAADASARISRTDLLVRLSEIDERTKMSVLLPQRGGEVELMTSGTSGPAKRAVHTWRSLAAAVHLRDTRYHGRRWLLAYEPSSFAGLQVLLQALLTGGTLVLPDRGSPQDIVNCIHRQQIEMASATPTFWRGLLCGVDADALRESALAQVTLGGEIADQPLLNALRDAIPKARISHVYASTEMGVCFAVHDERAGFPADWLDATWEGDSTLGGKAPAEPARREPRPPNQKSRACAMRVAADGELLIRSSRRMRNYASGPRDEIEEWFPTGDLVRIDGERAHFAGRKSDTIHVGGNKVQPVDVEAVIRTCESVQDVRVFGLESSLTGQLAAAEVWAKGDVDEYEVRQKILDCCRQRLPKHMIPAVITFATPSRVPADKQSRTTLKVVQRVGAFHAPYDE